MLKSILIVLVCSYYPVSCFVTYSAVNQNILPTSSSGRSSSSSNFKVTSYNTKIFSSRHRMSLLRVMESSNQENVNNDDDDDDDMEKTDSTSTTPLKGFSGDDLGGFQPSKKLPMRREEVLVGDPQKKVKKKEKSVTAILKELAAIQQQGPQKYCILGTRHCSFLHQQIVELLSYALVLSENHVYTSGAVGTNAAAIRGALRAERPDLLTVILPQSLHKQPAESQDLLHDVTDLITMPQNDEMSLDMASRICNSKLLSETDQLIAFAFHESTTVIEATREAKKLEKLVTTLFLD